ncbi:MAG: Na+/H+ antiporter subunit E [Candidatus Kapabacteria bacterium]|nr:Na+/H+ antiporter subunit E [Ignavibacteriota bacterium]MCW5886192.1 Na+/H+ antiporter subunit E [Candidatus Kapabacteria bacterium]
MNIFLLNMILALSWALLTGNLDFINFVQGFVIGYIILYVLRSAIGANKYFRRIPKIISFVLFFLKELIKANLIVAFDILTPKDHMRPGIIELELDAETDAEITILANMITMTPGTLSIDLSEDKTKLYIHAMYIEDIELTKKDLKENFERPLLEVMR